MATGARFLLLIDTCGELGSVAVASADARSRVFARVSLPGRTASERLVPCIRDLLEDQKIALEELDAVAVVHGPGSFTGVRVGLSAAKGLCEARSIPLIAISRLAVLADMAAEAGVPEVLALVDAGRGEFYAGRYAGGLCQGEFLSTSEQLGEMMSWSPCPIAACEPAVAQRLAGHAPLLIRELEAADSLGLALLRLKAGAFDDPAKVDANYVRNSDAEIFAKRARPAPAGL